MFAKEETMLAHAQLKDALNSHEVSRKKMFSVEAQRILRILENCNSQVEIAASLSAVVQLNTSSTVVDGELSKALQEQQILAERLEKLHGVKQESGDELEEEVEETRNKDRTQLEKDIKRSVRDLLRFFQAHPDVIFSLRAMLGVEVGGCKLIRTLKVVHSPKVEKLLTSPNEELQLSLYKQVSSTSPNELDSVVSREEQVDTDIKEIDSLISQKQTENLLCSLETNNSQDEEKPPVTDKECQPHVETSKKQGSIEQEIGQLKIKLNNLIFNNRQNEREQQEKNEEVENGLEYLLQQFDDKMEENQADLEVNEIDYEREKEEVKSLQVPFSVLKVEHDQIQEKRRLAEEKRKEEMRVLELKTKAAIFAQAWWRGYSVRKALKNKAKTKKAKKGKDKKK